MGTPGKKAVFVVLFCFLSITGCKNWSQRGAKGIGLLPKASPGETKFSSYRPKNPYAKLAPDIATRTLFETTSGSGYRVEVRDLLVGPGKRTETVSLPGAAVFEVRSGSGLMTVGGKPRELSLGSTFALSEGETFSIENKSTDAIAMRVHLFNAQ